MANEVSQIVLDRRTGDGKYDDVIDVALELKRGDLASAANALAVMARQSALYQKTLSEMRKKARNGKRRS